MLTTAAEYAWTVRPGVWRRYLALILAGLRSAPSRTEMQQAHQRGSDS